MAKVSRDERVSVVVITYNRREELDRTLRRLAELPEKPPVIVVNNASTDGTGWMVRTRHPEVALLTSATNLGAAGRNHGLRLATTPYVAFCDDDTWYEPGALHRAADLLDTHPGLAVVTSRRTVEPDGKLDDTCARMAASPLDRAADIPGSPQLSFLAGACIVRRSAFLATSGFSARLWPCCAEEELLASDLARAGWQLSYVPDVVAHRLASRLRDGRLRRQRHIRNTLWFTWLRRPLRSAVVRTIRLLRRLPRDHVSARGIADALRGLPWVLQERDPVPADLERGYRQLERSHGDGDAGGQQPGNQVIQRMAVTHLSSRAGHGLVSDPQIGHRSIQGHAARTESTHERAAWGSTPEAEDTRQPTQEGLNQSESGE